MNAALPQTATSRVVPGLIANNTAEPKQHIEEAESESSEDEASYESPGDQNQENDVFFIEHYTER